MSRSSPLSASAPVEIRDGSGRLLPVRVLINPRASRISLRVDMARGEAIATAPHPRARAQAIAFAAERADWIAATLARRPQPQVLSPGAVLPVRGVAHRLAWTPGRGPARFQAGSEPTLEVPAPEEALFSGRVLRFLQREARGDLEARVGVHAATLGVRATRITIKDTRSRWGSCTSDGALAFSWRVILAPTPVLDYLAAHEVAHLREMNHSPRFWALVARCAPDYKAHRDWLRRHGAALHAVGAPLPQAA